MPTLSKASIAIAIGVSHARRARAIPRDGRRPMRVSATDARDIQRQIDALRDENEKLRKAIKREDGDNVNARASAEASGEKANGRARENDGGVKRVSVKATTTEASEGNAKETRSAGDGERALRKEGSVMKDGGSGDAQRKGEGAGIGAGETRVGADTAMRAEPLPERETGAVAVAAPLKVVSKTKNPMKIVFVTSEVAPWSKTGGLADVCGSLPQALVARGHRVMVVAPRYLNQTKTDKLYEGAFDTCVKSKLGCFGAAHEVGYFHQVRNGVDYVFVDHPSYQRPGGLYGDSYGVYGDNQFRYTLLSHAACEAPLVLPFNNMGGRYGDDVIFVANDWHAGLVPTLVASKYRKHGVYNNARTICAIHNILHQGVEPATTFPNLGVPNEWYGALEYQYPEHMRAHALDKGLVVNILKGAIATSDRVLTVSEGYAFEITTPEGGKGMEGLLLSRKHNLDGIANGIDMDEWNPSADKDCAAPYSVLDFSGKLECKRALQKELGLPVRDNVPMMGFIGRLDWQKGPDLLQAALNDMMREDVQVVMLGSGLPELEDFMRWAEQSYKDKFRGWVGFSVPMAHRITAGCDILLMPSRFEPCGLNQLYAMRYGTLPIAHATGGLKDTIASHNAFGDADKVLAGKANLGAGEGVGTGWLFNDMNAQALMWAIRSACDVYRNNPKMWRAMQTQAMTQDLSWDAAGLKWEQVFEWAKIDKPWCK